MTTAARRACVIGHPVAHSRSPLIHGHWLRHYGIDGAYERVDVPPEALPDFLAHLADHGFVGGNVTLPHKEAALRLVVHASRAARTVGAVNTLWLENGVLCGDNSDVRGFLAHLDATVPGWQASTRRVVVIGAGGAARAIVHGLIERGIGSLTIVNRDMRRAELLAGEGSNIAVAPWADRSRSLADADLLVNTTSLGLAGQPALDIDLGGLPSCAIVYDIVYVPVATPLLAAASARGLRTVDGLGMLLHQAVPGFARWFGIVPEVTPALSALVAADILASQ